MQKTSTDQKRVPSATAKGRARCAELFSDHGDELFAFCRRLVGDAASAEDVVQEAFLKIARAIDKLEDGRDPKPWLYSIVRNAAADHHRRAAASQRAAGLGRRPEATAENLSANLEREERRSVVESAASELAFDERSALLAFAQGLTLNQIATILACSPPTAKKRLRSATRSLSQALARRRIREGDEL